MSLLVLLGLELLMALKKKRDLYLDFYIFYNNLSRKMVARILVI